MKSALALSFISAVAALPAQSIKEATTCPGLDGGQALSNNNNGYKLHCAKWIDSDPIRITDTEVGYKGCLTACDGTIGCGAVQYIATDEAQTKGSCTVFPKSELKDGDSNSWTVAVPIDQSGAAEPKPKPEKPQPTRFGGLAIRSGSEIQYASVNANGLEFWLYKNTSTYCPETVGDACPDGTPQTIFRHAKDSNTLSLDTTVPGGQQVYVTSEGQLKFTQAHSANTGEGSFTTGFDVVEGAVKFENSDFYACPLGEDEDGAYGVWAVSRVKGSNAGAGCLGFRFRAEEAGKEVESAWQYS